MSYRGPVRAPRAQQAPARPCPAQPMSLAASSVVPLPVAWWSMVFAPPASAAPRRPSAKEVGACPSQVAPPPQEADPDARFSTDAHHPATDPAPRRRLPVIVVAMRLL